MINARRHTFFGAGHGIGRPGQANSEYGAAQETQAAAQAAKLRGAGFIRYWLGSSRSSGAPQGYAGVVR